MLELMGKTVRDVRHEAELWIDDGPLAGWGSVPVDHVRMVNRLRTICDGLVSAAMLDRIERNWLRHGPPADAMARVGAVMANPDTWRNLFGDVEAGARDADQRRPPREAPPPKGW